MTQPVVARCIMSHLSVVDMYNCLMAIPAWRKFGTTPLMFDDQSDNSQGSIAQALECSKLNDCVLGLLGGGPKCHGGVMSLLAPLIPSLYSERLHQPTLCIVEVDLRDQSIDTNDYLIFFDYAELLPKLRVLSATVNTFKASAHAPFAKNEQKLALDSLWLHAVDIKRLRKLACLLSTMQNVPSVYFRQSRCKPFHESVAFNSIGGVKNLTISAHSQLFDYMTRTESPKNLFPDLIKLRLLVYYAFVNMVNTSNFKAKFPGVEISVSLSSTEYFRMDRKHILPASFLDQRRPETCAPLDGGTQLLSFRLAKAPACEWVAETLPEMTAGLSSELIIRTDMWSHGQLECSKLNQHRETLFSNNLMAILTRHIGTSLRVVNVAADVVYGAVKTVDVSLNSVQRLIIQSDVAATTWSCPESAQLSNCLVNFVRLFPALQFMLVEPNFQIDWNLVDALPCAQLSTLCICTGSTGRRNNSFRGILRLLSGLGKLRVLALRLGEHFDAEDMLSTNFCTSLQHVFIGGDDAAFGTSETKDKIFHKCGRLQSLIMHGKMNQRSVFYQRGADMQLSGNTQNLLRKTISMMPQFYGVFWEHILNALSDFTIAIELKDNSRFR